MAKWRTQDTVVHDGCDFQLQSNPSGSWRIIHETIPGNTPMRRVNIWRTTNGSLAQGMFRAIYDSHLRRLAELES